MVEIEFQQKTKALIDSLKTICAHYGLGNDGNEFKIITQTFLYKFLNDKFAFEAKKIDPTIAKAEKWEEALIAMSEDELEMLQLQMGGDTARLKPHHFISYLFSQQNAPDFAKLFDDTLRDIAQINNDVFAVKTDGGAKVVLFDRVSEYISDESKRDAFCRAIINKLVEFSFERIFTEKFDFYATIFEYLIKDYNSNAGGKYAEYYTPHAVARIMAAILVPAEQQGIVKSVSCYDPSSNSLADLVTQIATQVEQARQHVRQAVNTAMVESYWQIGRMIVEHEQHGNSRAEYGQQQLVQLSQQLTERLGKGFDVTNLRNMRRFYLAFPIRETVSLELSWSHYNVLARLDNARAREWYLQESISRSWSVRALERQISTLYYERLLASQDRAVVEQEAQAKTTPLQETVKDYLRDPYILDFLNLQDKTYQESELENAIIGNLQQFLLELGKGFAFVERQQRIRFDDEDFYIDLVFYNFKLKCFLLIDLKLGKLKHQDIGQMDTYVRLYDEQRKGADDNPTIGLVLCSEKSESIVKYSILADQRHLFAAKYLPYLPSEEELKRELERERTAAIARLGQIGIQDD